MSLFSTTSSHLVGIYQTAFLPTRTRGLLALPSQNAVILNATNSFNQQEQREHPLSINRVPPIHDSDMSELRTSRLSNSHCRLWTYAAYGQDQTYCVFLINKGETSCGFSLLILNVVYLSQKEVMLTNYPTVIHF